VRPEADDANGGVAEDGLDLGVELVLEVESFRNALLYELRPLDGGARVVPNQELAGGGATLGQAERDEGRPDCRDRFLHPDCSGWIGVEECDRLACGQEQGGPALTDDPSSEGRHTGDA
jgi:hypothetical protein